MKITKSLLKLKIKTSKLSIFLITSLFILKKPQSVVYYYYSKNTECVVLIYKKKNF